MSLTSQLDQARRAFFSRLGEEQQAVFNVALARLRSGDQMDRARRAGDAALDFSLPRADGAPVRLVEALTSGPVVVTFIQGGWSPFCAAELKAWERMVPYAKALGTRILAVTPQTPIRNGLMALELGLSFDVVADAGCATADLYGLRYTLPPTLRAVFAQLGFDLADVNGNGQWAVPLPATYVVTQDGVIARAFVDVDATRRMEPLDALQAVAELHADNGARRA